MYIYALQERFSLVGNLDNVWLNLYIVETELCSQEGKTSFPDPVGGGIMHVHVANGDIFNGGVFLVTWLTCQTEH